MQIVLQVVGGGALAGEICGEEEAIWEDRKVLWSLWTIIIALHVVSAHRRRRSRAQGRGIEQVGFESVRCLERCSADSVFPRLNGIDLTRPKSSVSLKAPLPLLLLPLPPTCADFVRPNSFDIVC